MSTNVTLRKSAGCQKGKEGNRIALSYLMVVEQRLPLYRDPMGQLYAGELWQKDLQMHLEYLDHLMLASPCLRQVPPPDAKQLTCDESQLEIVELPVQGSFLRSLVVMPTILYRLCKAVRRADIVHSGIVGWPIPMGWIMAPLSSAFRKPLVIVVESAPWRLPRGFVTGWKRRARAVLQEFIGRWVIRKAELVICTQDEYRQSLVGPKHPQAFVIPASWIDEKDVLSEQEAGEKWDEKLGSSDGRLNILFVGRLTPEKGLLVLLEAMRHLSSRSVPISLGILGEGPLREQCEQVASELTHGATVKVLGTVAYGAPLFQLIRGYDAVVVPSISDEQPRIVFDALSQAVSVIASDTAGLRSCVPDGEAGLLVKPNDVSALARVLSDAVADRAKLKRLGIQSLLHARAMTHQDMHRQRAGLLQAMISRRGLPNRPSQ